MGGAQKSGATMRLTSMDIAAGTAARRPPVAPRVEAPRREAAGRLPARRRAAVALAVLARGAAALPSPASAQARTTVRSATLTVDEAGDRFGCANHNASRDNCSSASVLTDDDVVFEAMPAANNRVKLTWNDPSDPAITGREYRDARADTYGQWTAIPGSGAGDPDFEIGLDAMRTESANDNGIEHGVMLRGTAGGDRGPDTARRPNTRPGPGSVLSGASRPRARLDGPGGRSCRSGRRAGRVVEPSQTRWEGDRR